MPIETVRNTSLLPLAAVLAALTLALPAQHDPDDIGRRLATFGKASAATQDEVLAAVRSTVANDAWAAVRLGWADAATIPGTERTRRLAVHAHKPSPAGGERPDVVVPAAVRYVFGVGGIEPVDAAAGAKGTGSAHSDAARRAREVAFEQALRGLVPRADAALAEVERRLDADTAGDRFAAFLHAWRNGPESFYEALDRTAGTPESVFFYDAMLADFARTFAGGAAGSGELPTGLQGRRDALQDAFLAYRQYRGFREAVAYALVLPPAVPLPARLHRYETAVPGSYSLRQQVVMVAEVLDGDVEPLIAAIVASAPPLPHPIWSAPYDPYPAWNRIFVAQMPRMIEAAGHTDAFLDRAQRHLAESSAAIRAAARDAIDAVAGRPAARR